jgi:hypothetical protein
VGGHFLRFLDFAHHLVHGGKAVVVLSHALDLSLE